MESCFCRIEISVCGTQGLDTAVREYRENGVAYSMFRSSKVFMCRNSTNVFNDPPYSLIRVCMCANSFVHSVSNVQ